ncbi:MAG TPA: Rrf2 family transcriptional regulator [Candidatus Marinimicrobia bacterium]|nr:Rrf2 family transcriptional regulator [Candidatus Neomarinimicrobiota bacterium]
MIRLSTKGKYGARLMFQLALNYGNGPMLLKEIAAREDLSVRYLEHLVPPLRTARLILSMRGSKGGYSLAKKPQDITLKEIVRVLEGPFYPSECVEAPDICNRSSFCVTRNIWAELEQTISATLASHTLQDLVDEYRKAHTSEESS